MQLHEKAHLMTGSEIDRTLVHLAHEIAEKSESLGDLAIVGVRRRGFYLAERLARKIAQMTDVAAPVGGLDIRQYRDDIGSRPDSSGTRGRQFQFSIAGKDVLLVDDVLHTGRTTRAALDALFDHGRPRRIRLCVLLDRGHRELPIEASFVGKRVEAAPDQIIEVKLREEDETEKVVLLEEVKGKAAGG
jgi:pyrimidine operon attenuation protein/uracil phosphoribosyltransferase